MSNKATVTSRPILLRDFLTVTSCSINTTHYTVHYHTTFQLSVAEQINIFHTKMTVNKHTHTPLWITSLKFMISCALRLRTTLTVFLTVTACYHPNLVITCLRTYWNYVSLPSARQHPSYGDCLEVKREYYQNCSVLGCVTQCSQSAAHSCEQFLQV